MSEKNLIVCVRLTSGKLASFFKLLISFFLSHSGGILPFLRPNLFSSELKFTFTCKTKKLFMTPQKTDIDKDYTKFLQKSLSYPSINLSSLSHTHTHNILAVIFPSPFLRLYICVVREEKEKGEVKLKGLSENKEKSLL